MSKHTPEPWYWENYAGTTLLLGGERRTIILDDACCNPQDNALIAAAPDLLSACKELLEAAESEGWDRYKGTDEPRNGIAAVRAAVAKAEGHAL